MILTIDTTNNLKTTIKLDARVYTKTYQNPREQDVWSLLHEALEKESTALTELTAIEVNTGPGSFTGIRVGVSIAQALAFVLQIPLNGQTAVENIEVDYGGKASITLSGKIN